MTSTYQEELAAANRSSATAMLKDMFFLGAGGDRGRGDRGDRPDRKDPARPRIRRLSGANPRPDWPFLWTFGLLSLSPPEAETAIILTMPIVLVLGLLAVPFISNRGERAPSRRPVAVLMVVVIYAVLGVLTYEGQRRRGRRR